MNKRYVIIGGIAGGISAAERLRRLDGHAVITVFEKNEHVAFASSALPYCLGGLVSAKDIVDLQSRQETIEQHNIDIRCQCEVTAIDRYAKAVTVHNLSTDETYREEYDKLIIATGTKPVRPDIQGLDMNGIFTLKDMRDLSAVSAHLEAVAAKRAAVVGAGNVGLEIAENLSSRGIKTCVIEQTAHALPFFDADMAHFARHALEDNSVALITNAAVQKIEGSEEGLRMLLSNGKSIFADIVIICAGVRPESALVKAAGLGIGVTGGILVDERMQTTDKDIYAVGDAVELESVFTGKVLLSKAPVAIRQGRTAADNICGVGSRFRQVLGVSVVKIFDTHMASAGLAESELADKDIRYEKIYVSGTSRESYFPGTKSLVLKLLFEKKTGRLLGAQMVGEEGVDKHIDVLAAAMRCGLTADKLSDLELAYAPAFGPVRDVISMAGYVAADVLSGLSDVVHWHEVKTMKGALLLDVRTQKERDSGTIAGSVHIPLNELKSRIHELPADKQIIVFSRSGKRSYTAERMLKNAGLKAKNLSGGYALFEIFNRKG